MNATEAYQPTLYEQEPTSRDPHFYDEKAYKWILSHQHTFKWVQMKIFELWQSGRNVVRRGDIYNESRKAISTNAQFFQDNNIWASLVRYIIDIHPDWSSKQGGPLETRRSAIDDVKRRPLDWRYVWRQVS
ncbi:MAG: hypothetical protein IJH04_06890 [Eggerthellaceae bacterium]|nr:hypothetical protein [Eggerthellaceae bacterium]